MTQQQRGARLGGTPRPLGRAHTSPEGEGFTVVGSGQGAMSVAPRDACLLKQSVQNAGLEVHTRFTGGGQVKGQARNASGWEKSEIRGGFLEEAATRLAPTGRTRTKGGVVFQHGPGTRWTLMEKA